MVYPISNEPFRHIQQHGHHQSHHAVVEYLVYLASTQAFRQHHPALAGLSAILFFVGTAVYFSSNAVLSLFALSQQYAMAAEAQKPI